MATDKGVSILKPEQVLIVDDERSVREVLSAFLTDMGYTTLPAASAEEALALMGGPEIAVALVDIKLPGIDGLQCLEEIKKLSPQTEVVLMTSYASLETAIDAIRKEAYAYLQKPFESLDEVWVTVRRALEKRSLYRKNQTLVRDLEIRNLDLSAAVQRQKALISAGRAMGGILELQKLLDFFIGVVTEELGVDRASVMLLDRDHDEMWVAASRGLSEEVIRNARLKVGEGIAGWVAREGKPVLVKDLKAEPKTGGWSNPTLSNSFMSAPIVLSIPILLQERVLGVINVTNRRSGAQFYEEDMEFLYSLAGQAAASIERSRHFEDLQKAYESLKTAQNRLVDSERLKAVGQLAAGVAHDFNNLLNGILGRAQLLKARVETIGTSPRELLEELEAIERIAFQGAENVRRIQEFSRIRKDVPSESLDLNDVVATAVKMTRTKWKDECEARGIPIEVEIRPGDIPRTAGETGEICRVICNLIINSVEAMPRGGTLSIATSREGDDLLLEVSDTGIGMSREVRERLFEPFYTTKETGQGLGASIIYGIVARHQGKIEVSSEEGWGTTVRMRLPVITPTDRGSLPPESIPPPGKSGAKVLIIDDGEENRIVFHACVEAMGHRPSSASCGQEGLAILEKEPFDVVVTDFSMPGISGLQVAERVKEIRPEVPVILVSGWAVQRDEPEVRRSGVDFVLQKPCSLADFREAVAKALSSPPGVHRG